MSPIAMRSRLQVETMAMVMEMEGVMMVMVMAVAQQWISSPQMCADGFLEWRRVCGGFWRELYMGPLTKVAWFDLAKAVAPGTAGRYGRGAAISTVVKPSDAPLRGLFDLGKLVTRKSLLISPDSAKSVHFCKEKIQTKDLHIFAIISD